MTFARPLAVTLLAVALLSLAGCGGTIRTIDDSFPSTRDWFEGEPSAIAVLPGDYIPFLSLNAPEPPAQSTSADSATAATTVAAGCGAGTLTECTDGVLAAPLGTLVESIISSQDMGNWAKYGNPKLQQAGEQLKHNLADRRPHLLISHAVVERIRAGTKYDAQLKAFRGHPEDFVPEGPFNGVVEIGLTKFGLATDSPLEPGVDDPKVALEIAVRANVYSMRDRNFVRQASGGWEYLGSTYRLSKLMAENGRLLNEEIERAAKTLARRIVN